MGKHWCIHLPDFLAENGTIAAYSPRGLRLANYWTEIVPQCEFSFILSKFPFWMS